jgi:phenylpropionate dioxygenase-like ring-hydroxylating dioxygenase large terminal subunit
MMDGVPAEAWYMAAWSHEVGEPLLRRRLLGHAILLYRLADGSVAALDDRCPHRFAPLSLGTRNGDEVTCAYHGLTFDGSGACVRNPFGAPPKGASVRRWPVNERDGIVWLWAGDPAGASDTALPDFSILHLDQPAPPISGLMPMAANYQYGTDNLMDLSHIEFVHRGSFAGRGVIFAGRHEVRQDGDFLHSNWWMPDVPAPAHTFGIYPPEMRTDPWLEMRWQAPATMLLEIGATPAGGDRKHGVIVYQAHILTPETADRTHYFWATTRSGGPVTDEGDAMLRALMSQAFVEEDKPIIEAAFSNLDGEDFWAARPVFLGIDAAGTRARRLLQTMISRPNHEGPQI